MSIKHRYRIEDETSPEPCGFDYESFIDGLYCENKVERVVIEDDGFHFAHLCTTHTDTVMALLNRMGLAS